MIAKNKLVHGVGINDADYYVRHEVMDGVKKIIWTCPFYARWLNMLTRCYYKSYQDKYPSYKGCFVCDEWLYFSNFRAWMVQQDWEGKELDKDLLVRNNKEYGPKTCIFVSKDVNNFMTEVKASRGLYPTGVNFHKLTGKFASACKDVSTGKRKHLGIFATPEEAYQVWFAFKLEQAYTLADRQTDERISKALISRYKNDTEKLFEQAMSWYEEGVE